MKNQSKTRTVNDMLFKVLHDNRGSLKEKPCQSISLGSYSVSKEVVTKLVIIGCHILYYLSTSQAYLHTLSLKYDH